MITIELMCGARVRDERVVSYYGDSSGLVHFCQKKRVEVERLEHRLYSRAVRKVIDSYEVEEKLFSIPAHQIVAIDTEES